MKKPLLFFLFFFVLVSVWSVVALVANANPTIISDGADVDHVVTIGERRYAIFVGARPDNRYLYRYDNSTGILTTLLSNPTLRLSFLQVTPDEEYLVFMTGGSNGDGEIWRVRPDGTDPLMLVPQGAHNHDFVTITSDARYVLYAESGTSEIYTVPLAGGAPRLLTQGLPDGYIWGLHPSPSGAFVAFFLDDMVGSTADPLFVARIDGATPAHQVTPPTMFVENDGLAFAESRNTIVFRNNNLVYRASLSSGAPVPLGPAANEHLLVTPDDRYVIHAGPGASGNWAVYRTDLQSNTTIPLATSTDTLDQQMIFAGTSHRVLLTSTHRLYSASYDTPAPLTVLDADVGNLPDLRPVADGTQLIYKTNGTLYNVPTDGSAVPLELYSEKPVNHYFRLTPDEQYVVFTTFEDGEDTVAVVAIDGGPATTYLSQQSDAPNDWYRIEDSFLLNNRALVIHITDPVDDANPLYLLDLYQPPMLTPTPTPPAEHALLDPTFGGQGIAHPIEAMKYVRDFVLLPDGGVMATGSFYNVRPNGGVHYDFGLMKLNPDGSVDTDFGQGGYIQNNLAVVNGNATSDIATTIVRDAQGRFVVAGRTEGTMSYQSAIVRYLPNGTLDPSFGAAGVRNTTELGNGVQGLVIAADGKLIGISSVPFNPDELGIVFRLNEDGSLDTSLGGDGIIGDGLAGYDGLLVEQDGRIVVVGDQNRFFKPPQSIGMVIARFLPDGTPDPAFGNAGRLLVDEPGNLLEYTATDVVKSPDGTYVVSGSSVINNVAQNGLIVKVRANGTLDPTFADDGIYTSDDAPNARERFARLYVDDDGRITAAMREGSRVVQLLPNGDHDLTFGDGGVATMVYNLGTIDGGIQKDTAGRVYVGGVFSYGAVIRFHPDGERDRTFGYRGYTIFGQGPLNDTYPRNITRLSDGRWITLEGGRFMRLTADGVPDVTLNPSAFTYLGGWIATTFEATVDSVDRVLVAGGVIGTNSAYWVVGRYTADGEADSTFGTGGIVQETFGKRGVALDVIEQSDGKVVAAGGELYERTSPWIVRYLANGQRDTTFGTNGVVSLTDCTMAEHPQTQVVQQADGKLIITAPCPSQRVYRLNTDGSPDTDFGTNGSVTVTGMSEGRDLQLDDNGNILVLGRDIEPDLWYAIVVRFTPSGEFDSTFGVDGRSVFDIEGALPYRVMHRLLPDGHGRWLVVSEASNSSSSNDENWVTRLRDDGTLDASFGVGGSQKIAISSEEETIGDAVMDGDRLVVVCTCAFVNHNEIDPALVWERYTIGEVPSVPPTPTPIPPSATPTATATNTPITPSQTPTGTVTPTPTIPTVTSSPTPAGPTLTATNTPPIATATGTATVTPFAPASVTPGVTITVTPSSTPVATATPATVPTNTPIGTATATPAVPTSATPTTGPTREYHLYLPLVQ